ncbi:hypothetical protein B0H13DRAFT_2340259 [Mycena leptocephala]|nr:hypothetical protein B0H13DRAFT_2340259 [Mycena leptocephala]
MQKVLLDPQIRFTTNLPREQQISPIPEPPNLSEDANIPRDLLFELHKPSLTPFHVIVGLEDTTPYIQPDVRNVHLRIRDRRSESNEFNVIQRVNINLVDNVDCRDNEWRASSIEIFKELQASIGQLDGRIGVPDSEEPEYTEYFVIFNVKDKTETFSQNLSNIIIPDGNKLALRVDPVQNNLLELRLLSCLRYWKAVVHLRVLLLPNHKQPWTRELPGFGRRLRSAQVESWQFAAQVTSTFQKTSWPTEISSTTIISKTAIEKALGISTTSLNEAINMTRIITIYKCDGPNRSAEVIAEVTKIQQADALGASALKSFLQSWVNDHPVVDN